MGITKLSMNRVIWNPFAVMSQERLLPEQQELLHNKSQQNTRWKLIPSHFVIKACWTKWKQLPRSLVCMRTSVDVLTRWILTALTGECVSAADLSICCCFLFLQSSMSYISATIVLGFLLAAIPLSLPYTHISLPTTCWLDLWIWIKGSQFTESSFLIKGKKQTSTF